MGRYAILDTCLVSLTKRLSTRIRGTTHTDSVSYSWAPSRPLTSMYHSYDF